ncbi:Cell envelope-associated transcriptional attenuator LytR-CpsA-Psr [Amycolatopsis camponoti]|uniref:Cell envelope-associated transcriptional attenuator LytR-CpsA-Psr n=1 Tax=Amycolatopsis camponoti TaxID=2606593 RepID=A0A6I8M5E2_9PSEU|nr:LCP family protein [Amycolatopsis camponoti]VVJ24546.1 Cell envelope-associated transcriptional attenuator LytR-CpsA-Psr [Amycolatopsis camponoti]
MDDEQEKPDPAAEPVTERDDSEWKPSPFPREAAPAPVAARPSRVRRAGRVTRRVAVGLVSVLALGASGYAYVTKDQLQSTVPTTDALTPRAGEPAPPPADDGADDILLVGSDARTDAQGNQLPPRVLRELRTEANSGAVNTDTVILLRVPKDGSKPSAVSVPRDTWTDIPGRGKAKINSAYGIAKAHFAQELRGQGERDQAKIERDSDTEGRRVLVQAVQDLTQVRVDHYAEINLLGFYLLTEALGGVKVCLNHSTEDKDSGANFRRGEQTVSGGEALSFVRQRKNLPRGDLDRIVRQQAFLSSALRQVLSAGTLTSPGTLNNLMDAVHRSLTLDPGLDLLQFAQQAKGIASGDLTFATIPVITANGRSEDGQSIVEIDPKAVREFVAGLAGRAAPVAAKASGGGSGSGAAPAAAPLLQASDGVPCVN